MNNERFALASISITAYDIAQSLGIVYIVRDLAAMQPLDRSGSCLFCGGHRTCIESHTASCLWKRAHDIVASGTLDSKGDALLRKDDE